MSLSTPTPIGPVHFDLPRAVMVREPEDTDQTHSAIHGGVNVYVDSRAQANAVLAAWPVIMQAMADKVGEVIAAVAAVPSQETG